MSASCRTRQLELGQVLFTSSLRRVYFRLSNFLLQRQPPKYFRCHHSQLSSKIMSLSLFLTAMSHF